MAPRPFLKSIWRHYTRGRRGPRRLFVTVPRITSYGGSSRDHRVIRRRRLSVLVRPVNLPCRVEKKRAPARLSVRFRRGHDFESGIIARLRGADNAIAKPVSASAAGSEVFVHERRLLGRDFVLGSGTQLRERIGQLAEGAAIRLDRLTKTMQRRERGILARGEIALGPLL